MDALIQAIKNLDQLTFQQFCYQVMHAKHPSANIRYVEGFSGDAGADFFVGDLSAGPTVWQCKAFVVTILRDSQKEQIRKSLREAVKHLRPRLWVLCLNMNLDTKAHHWFQRLQQSYAAQGMRIADPVQGIDLARELMFRRSIRNHYFPGLALDPMELRGLVTGSTTLDNQSLEQLATENVEQWLERIQANDPRLSYEITVGGDRGPDTIHSGEPNLIASLNNGRTTIKAFARDVEALRLDPIGIEFHTTETGADKVLDLIRTGREQQWEPQEIVHFTGNMPLLSSMPFAPDKMSLIARSAPDQKPIPLRLTFKSDSTTVMLEYVEFRKTRQGTDEVELVTDAENPLQLKLVLPNSPSRLATATIGRRFVGKSVRTIAPVCRALRLLQTGCDIELYALHIHAKLGVMRAEPIELGLKPGFFSFIEDLFAISTRFNADFMLPHPDAFTKDDEETFRLLRALALNEPLRLNTVTVRLIKSEMNAATLPQYLRARGAFRTEHDTARATLFGTPIAVGRCALQMDEAEVQNLPDTLAHFQQVPIGEVISISLRPLRHCA